MAQAIPTKGNLLALKRSMSLAQLGFDLMDRKRNILIREMMGLIDRAAEIQGRIDSTFRQAYAALQAANITLGNCEDLAKSAPLDDSVEIRFRSVMGVEIPRVTMADTPPAMLGFVFTNSMLDEATLQFAEVKRLTRELAEVETSIYRLAFAVRKTQKRANALQNIIIPDFTRNLAFITDALEEKEREEFVRMKVIKRKG
ncbi:MAG: V-type ATP synthase subunit D [Oscillospiraceae bacterium]|jgi:V/A-type H+-transporting ATPase subunit D|nr:V-type ATP synthase subunit D [Oscillospiraceae bacterium]